MGLALIFQASLYPANIPDEWCKAIVTAIFQGGNKDHSKVKNYRPISLTSITRKVLEQIIHRNIISHLDQQRMLTDVQHGFCKSRSCKPQLIKTVNDLAKSLSEGKQVDRILLDFSKAFDIVCQQKLSWKLQYYGIQGKNLKWIENF